MVGFGTWIWDLDLGLGFGTGLGLDNILKVLGSFQMIRLGYDFGRSVNDREGWSPRDWVAPSSPWRQSPPISV